MTVPSFFSNAAGATKRAIEGAIPTDYGPIE
jgi:hypothetical protein